MAKNMNPQAVAKRWADAAANNVQRYVDGVQSVTESPTQKAAAAVDKYAAGVQRAVSDGTYQQGLQAVSLEDWKQAAAGKGKANMATGVRAAESKVAKVMTTLLPYTEQVKQAVAGMPKITLEDSIARSRKAIEMMAQYRKPR